MASSTASQMTSNLMTGQGMFDNLDYGINPGIILPLYADIGSRFSSIRTRLIKEQYVSEDGSNVTEAWPWVRRTEIQDNGDLVVHTMFETEKWVPDYYKNKFFGGQKLVPAHMETSSFNYYNPVMVSNYRNIVQSLVISWSFK